MLQGIRNCLTGGRSRACRALERALSQCAALFVIATALISAAPAVRADTEEVIVAQAGPLYPMFGEGYGVTKYIEALTGLFAIHPAFRGQVELKVFDKGILYATQEANIEAVSIGAIQLSYCVPHMLESYDSAFKVASAPGLFDDFAHFKRAMQTKVWRDVHARLAEKSGLRILKWLFNAGELYLFSTVPINEIDDLRGRKIRHPGGEGWALAIEGLGAHPIAIPYTEVVTSLQTNLISGLITDFAGGADYFNLAKLAPHAVIVPVTIQPICFVANTSWWESLSSVQRAAIEETFETLSASVFYDNLTRSKIAEWQNNADLNVVYPDNAAHWQETMRKGVRSLLAEVDPSLVQAILDSRTRD